MEEEEKRAKFWFAIPKDPERKDFSVQIKYFGVAMGIRLEDTDACEDDLLDLLKYVPMIVKQGRTERAVVHEVAGIDNELSELLGDE